MQDLRAQVATLDQDLRRIASQQDPSNTTDINLRPSDFKNKLKPLTPSDRQRKLVQSQAEVSNSLAWHLLVLSVSGMRNASQEQGISTPASIKRFITSQLTLSSGSHWKRRETFLTKHG
ncbi:hypothetical protein JG687_00005376 [Phytophthora cactorum]|uniref:Uncharacterized protein n=1 Tax=Phytophthora cactorum TaxID=29920 RepID=A0A8T1UL19_9STRA|nr:hypothetical protein GQ600_3371 [Phytophthora cactorum]KAG6965548.1 hypothetical protein JG687_00005376 [Phytophthora cactorum]